MHDLQMVDLKRQYLKIKPEIDTAIQNVIDSSAFIKGSDVGAFAGALADYLGVKHVIPCGNGTDALQITLMALDLQPGDEVITPSFTYMATVEVVALLRLKPVFVDVDPETFTMDIDKVKEAISNKTKAIIPVHLYGQSADMEPLLELAAAHHIPVIEDNAQATGSDYIFSDGRTVKTGTMGLAGTTSFFPSKTLGCFGDGGAIFTNNDSLAEKMRMVANHGQKVRYLHDIVGCNSRLDSIQAAVLGVKLKYLDDYILARRTAADFYDAAFRENEYIICPYRATYSRHVFYTYTILLKNVERDAVKQGLTARHIPSQLYYPLPCHKQPVIKTLYPTDYELPVTDMLQDRMLSLPMHTELSNEELAYICDNIIEVINRVA
ncbi:MAG: transcriptional regulator [Bacteroidetes bacterium 46-16]|nr:MAG: transcriptional regulator [Bacteroidetes bacterium 46-16]